MPTAQKLDKPLYVVAAKRIPFGTYGGMLKSYTNTDMQVCACSIIQTKNKALYNKILGLFTVGSFQSCTGSLWFGASCH